MVKHGHINSCFDANIPIPGNCYNNFCYPLLPLLIDNNGIVCWECLHQSKNRVKSELPCCTLCHPSYDTGTDVSLVLFLRNTRPRQHWDSACCMNKFPYTPCFGNYVEMSYNGTCHSVVRCIFLAFFESVKVKFFLLQVEPCKLVKFSIYNNFPIFLILPSLVPLLASLVRSLLLMELMTKSDTAFVSFVMECCTKTNGKVPLFMCPNKSLSNPFTFPSNWRTIGNIWRIVAYLVPGEKWWRSSSSWETHFNQPDQ